MPHNSHTAPNPYSIVHAPYCSYSSQVLCNSYTAPAQHRSATVLLLPHCFPYHLVQLPYISYTVLPHSNAASYSKVTLAALCNYSENPLAFIHMKFLCFCVVSAVPFPCRAVRSKAPTAPLLHWYLTTHIFCSTVPMPYTFQCGLFCSAVLPQFGSLTSAFTYSYPTALFLQSLLGCSLNVQSHYRAVPLCSTIPLHRCGATTQFPHRQPSP